MSLKGGRKKYKRQKKETKEVETELCPRKGDLKREKFPNTRKHSLPSLLRALEAQRAT